MWSKMGSVTLDRSFYLFPDVVCCFPVYAALLRGIVVCQVKTAGLPAHYMSAFTELAGLRPGETASGSGLSAKVPSIAVGAYCSHACVNKKD
jgi:hypothetical protein